MKIAIVTPLPPQHTGIADYAADLIIGLSAYPDLELTLISNTDIKTFHTCPVHDYQDITDAAYSAFDLIIFQVGNNCRFHGYMLDLLKKFGGVIHLHDVVLHNLFAELFWAGNRPDEYYSIIKEHYGPETLEHVKHELSRHQYPWESPSVLDTPLFEEFVKYCDACIVHSDFAKMKIQAVFPLLDIFKVDQMYQMERPAETKTADEVINFGLFGAVDPQKNTDVVLNVFNTIKKEHPDIHFHLTISGKINEQIRHTLEPLLRGRLKNCVTITGRVDQETFLAHLNNTDLLIALRYPTMGETSGVVVRALQLGIPCIVNDIGWYSELPDHVIKIPVTHLAEELKNTLLAICRREQINSLKKQALNYSRGKLDFTEIIQKYADIIRTAQNNTQNSMLYRQLAHTMNDLSNAEEGDMLRPAVERLMDIF